MLKFFAWFLGSLLVIYALLWLASLRTYPVEYGISFNEHHATSLGLDWKETYLATLNDLKPASVRVAAMWKDVEAVKGQYSFSQVDFFLDEAEKRGVKVTLVVGQKAPRWPECHVPDWFKDEDRKEQEKSLLAYIQATVNRYQNHPALEFWQVENEPFIHFQFGECQFFRSDLVQTEVDLVRRLDPGHLVIMTDSGELGLWYKAARTGDILGTTLYRVVQTPTGKTVKYDWVPAGFYKFKRMVLGIKKENLIVSELQAEPWFTTGDPTTVPVDVQEKTMNPTRVAKHLDYVERVGVQKAYLWGVEWWYFMKEKRGDSRYWDLIQQELAKKK